MSTDNAETTSEHNEPAVEPGAQDPRDVSLTAIIERQESAQDTSIQSASDNADSGDAAGEVDTNTQQDAVTDASGDDEVAKLRQELELYRSLVDDDLVKSVSADEKSLSTQPASDNNDGGSEQEQSFLAPKEFSVTQEEIDDILTGDATKFADVMKRQEEAIRHNVRLEVNNTVAQAVQWMLPVALAAKSFNDRYPEMAMWPKSGEVINTALAEARRALPGANEAQLIRHVEKRLDPVIKRVKQAMAQAGEKRKQGQSQPPVASATNPRKPQNGTTKPKMSDLEYAQKLVLERASQY